MSHAETLPPTSPALTVIGRTAPTADGSGLLMAFPGIELRFTYTGEAPAIRLHADSDTCFFNLSINGAPDAVLQLEEGDNLVPLPSGPAPESGRLVSLVRRTEAWQGIVTFGGLEFDPTATQLLAAPAPRDRRVLVIGDSITTGHYVEQLPPTPDPTPRTNNAARTWGWILARSLGAEVNIVAYGGRGLIRTWDGRTDQANAPAFFERAVPDHPETPADPEYLWDHSRYTPDLIVIMLGQNDFNLGVPDAAHFKSTYRNLLSRLHRLHPDAAVILCGSPMQHPHPADPDSSDPEKRTTLYRWLHELATAAPALGFDSDRIAVVEVSHQPGTPLNAHPVVFQMEQIATEIAPTARQLTGW
ncbi:GDSL-type esterase/lipase family protein [Actomonas aquatica]|uniref:GDSL-type esterase/lipase family protein n=1 Tax=Actomonas aquatica TaxID=2866162 RepID=A0ABZ1C418_9BACT|nr:GDSL-type esterase/lipase family protein [Opitutus sp. WL0086]WRQ86092.1 GDSL-type esterase/lipase family protein [Opitutus sp. WL0086]